jgi:hypothetical protein
MRFPAPAANQRCREIRPSTESPPPVAILINGFTNKNLGQATDVLATLQQMNAVTGPSGTTFVAWNNLYSDNDGTAGNHPPNPISDDQMLLQLGAYMVTVPADQPVIMMGHSFGADTMLNYLTHYSGLHGVDVAVSLDPVQALGRRSEGNQVHNDVRYFYNRWQENPSPGFIKPDVAAIQALTVLPVLSVLDSDVYANPFPFDFTTSGSVPNPQARYVSQETQNTRHDASGQTMRKRYSFKFNIPLIGGGFDTGIDYADFPVYNTHASITSDPQIQSQINDILSGVYCAYVKPDYTGASWGTAALPFRSIQEALSDLGDHANHVDTIVLQDGEHNFVEASGQTIDPKYRVVAGSSNSTLKNSSWHAGNIQTPADWTMKIAHCAFGPGVKFDGPGGFEFTGDWSKIEGDYMPLGPTIVRGTDASITDKSQPDVLFKGPTIINSLRLGDPAHVTESRVEMKLEGNTILNFEHAEFVAGLKGKPRALIDISGNATAAKISTGILDTPSPAGDIVFDVEGTLTVGRLEQLTVRAGIIQKPSHPATHFGGAGLIHVTDTLEWQPANRLPALGSRESSLILDHGGRIGGGYSTAGGVVYMAGYMENRGHLILEATSRFSGSPQLGIASGDRWASVQVGSNGSQPGNAKWLNAPSASLEVIGNVFLEGGNDAAELTNANSARIDVDGSLYLNGGWNLSNEGTITVHNQATLNSVSPSALSNRGRIEVLGEMTVATLAPDTYVSTPSGSSLISGTWFVGSEGILTLPSFRQNNAAIIVHGNGYATRFNEIGPNGLLRLEAGSTFSYFDQIQFVNQGRVEIDHSTFNSHSFFNDAGGVVTGTGTLVGDLTNRSLVSPGFGNGQLLIQGNYEQQTPGTLAADIFDRLIVTGSANLTGRLTLNALAPITSAMQLKIVDANFLAGMFSDVPMLGAQLGYGVTFDGITYDLAHGDVLVSVLPSRDLADWDRDGRISAADFPAMLRALTDLTAFKTAHSLTDEQLAAIGDFDGDTKVTNRDLQPFLDFLASRGMGAESLVPEPASVWLALGLFSSLAAVRLSRRTCPPR